MTPLSFKEFDAVYQHSLTEIWQFWNDDMQRELARHCMAWAPGRIDFRQYLRLSSIRFYHAYLALLRTGGATVCDVGGFWGVWPVTLRRLGYEVAMTEALKYYGSSFDALFECIRSKGVAIYDFDPFSTDALPDKRFDLITVMAVLEHYPHSLKTFVGNVKAMTVDYGAIFFEAPNIAYWPKRIGMLRGRTPLAAIEDIYNSDVPFIGHHHEFTRAELRDLARLAGLIVLDEYSYCYSLADKNAIKLALRYPVMSAVFLLSKTSRECVAMLCR